MTTGTAKERSLMNTSDGTQERYNLERQGLYNLHNVYWNLPTPLLYEEAIRRSEARLSHLGPLVVRTGQHTGRSPNDKFIVQEASSEDLIWWGKVNHPMQPDTFDRLRQRMLAYVQGKDLFVE